MPGAQKDRDVRSPEQDGGAPDSALALVAATLVLLGAATAGHIFVLAPRYLAAIGYSEGEIGAVMGAFNVASLATMLAIGRLAGRFGLALPLFVAGLLAAAGTVVFASSESAVLLSLGRALQGVGFGAGLAGGFAAVAEIAPKESMARWLGASGIAVIVSQGLSTATGELLIVEVGWSGVFGAAAVAAVLASLAALALPRRRAEVAGVGAPGAAIAGLVSAALAGAGFGAIVSFLSDHAEQLGLSGVTHFFVAYMMSAVVARLVLGGLADRLGARAIAAPTLVVQGAALLLVALSQTSRDLLVAGLVFGVGHGLSYPALQALVVRLARRNRARAMAGFVFAFGLGAGAAAFGLGWIAEAASYSYMYMTAAGLSVAAALALAAARQP